MLLFSFVGFIPRQKSQLTSFDIRRATFRFINLVIYELMILRTSLWTAGLEETRVRGEP